MENSASSAVVDSTIPEMLKLQFERTSKGTRTTGDTGPDNVTRTVLPPMLMTLASIGFGRTERLTVSLTVAVSVTEDCAFTPAGTKIPTAMSVSR
jgi:hypothetical protein